MKTINASLTVAAALALSSTGTVFATGQPGATAGVNARSHGDGFGRNRRKGLCRIGAVGRPCRKSERRLAL
jgi:hypothetical protein